MIFFLFFLYSLLYQEMPFFGPNLRENYPTRNNKTNSKVIGKVIGLLVNSKLLFEKDFKQFRYRGRRWFSYKNLDQIRYKVKSQLCTNWRLLRYDKETHYVNFDCQLYFLFVYFLWNLLHMSYVAYMGRNYANILL